MMMRVISLTLIGLAVSWTSWAQPLELSLNEAIALAMDSSYAARDAAYNIDKRKKEVYEVMANGFPQIDGTLELQNFLEIPTSLIPAEFLGGEQGEFAEIKFGTEYNLTAGLTASQLLFDGTYFVGLQAAKTVVELSRAQLQKTKFELRLSVAQAYHSVSMAEENLRILNENIVNSARTVEETQALNEAGMNEQQDVDQVELNLNQLKISRDNAKRFVKISRQALNFAIGIDIDRDVTLTDNIESLVSLSSNEAYLMREPDLKTHPDYVLAHINVDIDELQIKGKQAQYYPSLSAFFNHQETAQRNEFNFMDFDQTWYPTSVIGVTLNLPIWSSFQRNAQVQQAKIGLMQSKLQMEQTEANLRLNIERSRSDYENALETWQNQQKSLQLAERIDRTTRIKYGEGVSDSFELNVSQGQLLNEQSKYIKAALDLLNAKRELDNALNIQYP